MIMLDSCDEKIFLHYVCTGIIRGVTTNPSILYKDKTIEIENIDGVFEEIARTIFPYPLSIEVSCSGRYDIELEAKRLSNLAKNIIVKIPIHDTDGRGYLNLIRALEQEKAIKTNVTCCMSAQQCLLASLAGASYVSLFAGRVNDMGHSAIAEIEKFHKIKTDKGLNTNLIAASVREVSNITDWLLAGADFVTVTPEILEKAIVHPYTKETVKQFMNDAEKLKCKNQ